MRIGLSPKLSHLITDTNGAECIDTSGNQSYDLTIALIDERSSKWLSMRWRHYRPFFVLDDNSAVHVLTQLRRNGKTLE